MNEKNPLYRESTRPQACNTLSMQFPLRKNAVYVKENT